MRSSDPLLHVIDATPTLGAWVERAACATVDVDVASVYTSDAPDPLELAVAQTVCERCPVQSPCADYAARVPVYGLWGARWRGRPTHRDQGQDRDEPTQRPALA
jgi:hypothetical protein